MIFICCVISACALGICFRLFPGWKINAFNAIVINYTVCLIFGLLLEKDLEMERIWTKPWFAFDIILGALFITGFNLISYAIKNNGITLSVLMQRMSLVLTVAFTVFIFKEKFGWMEVAGFFCVIASIICITIKNKKQNKSPGLFQILVLPLVLIVSAALEIILFYVQKTGKVNEDQMIFTTIGFGVAAAIGWLIMLIKAIMKKLNLQWRDLWAGLILGVPNYFSVYLILLMLQKGWKGNILYPLLNVSVLLLSTILAVFIFKESLTKWNRIGLGFAFLSILFIALAQNA